jgi:hypothetical protein
MFGLNALFAALSRLTRSVNTSADLFDAANEHLRKQLSIDGPADAPALEHHAEADAPKRVGRKEKAA